MNSGNKNKAEHSESNSGSAKIIDETDQVLGQLKISSVAFFDF